MTHRDCGFLRQPLVATTAAALVIGVTAGLGIAGCSSAASSKTTGKGTVAASAQTTAISRALRLAAAQSRRVNSLTAKLTSRSIGTGAGSLTGTVVIQLKPRRIIKAAFNVTPAKSAAMQLGEIATNTAVYFSDPAFTKAAGKPWVKANISELPSKVGLSLGSLLQNIESSNPLDQTTLFSTSKNARLVASAIIHGVPTIEYAGTYEPRIALAELTSSLRTLLGPTLHTIGTNPVQFEVWVDAHHIVRQAITTDNVHGQIVTTNLEVTSVNRPVHIALPPAHDVAPLPKI